MKYIVAIVVTLFFLPSADASSTRQPNVTVRWDSAALQGVRDSMLDAPMVPRALALVHTCMYDAWAAYDDRAVGTQLGGALRRPPSELTLANKEKTISYAAYRALSDLLPSDAESVYKPLMKQLGYDPNDNSTDIETPEGIGNVACRAVLEFRHHDKSNQLGDLAQGAYSDWTHFRPVNMPIPFPVKLPVIHPVDMNHWQPLIFVNSSGDFTTQMFTAAHWYDVTPFALAKGDEFRSEADEIGPATYGTPEYQEQAEELVRISADLTDREKTIAEYWAADDVPVRWMRFAQWVSERDHHTLDDDVKMFFALSNAMFDASIAAWDMKRAYDSVRPATAIPILFNSKKIRAWGGPGRGTIEMDGSQWIPYQAATLPTPASPDYVSEESVYSAAAAYILASWTGSEHFAYSITVPAGSSKIEPGVNPTKAVVLEWETFTSAADEAGMSSRYGGIHFRRADIAGRKLGSVAAGKVWTRTQEYFEGGQSGANKLKPAVTRPSL